MPGAYFSKEMERDQSFPSVVRPREDLPCSPAMHDHKSQILVESCPSPGCSRVMEGGDPTSRTQPQLVYQP